MVVVDDIFSIHVLCNFLSLIFLWLPEKGSHIVFTWPFLHFLTLPAAVAAKLLFQFKSDPEFKCVSHLGLHLGRSNFPRQFLEKKYFVFEKFFFFSFFFSTPNFVQPKAFEPLMLEASNFQEW